MYFLTPHVVCFSPHVEWLIFGVLCFIAGLLIGGR